MCERQREQRGSEKKEEHEAREGEDEVGGRVKEGRGERDGKEVFKIRGLLIKELWNLLESRDITFELDCKESGQHQQQQL